MLVPPVDDDEEIDHTVSPIWSKTAPGVQSSKKGQVQQIEWNEQMTAMSREKANTEAARGQSFCSTSESENEMTSIVLTIDLKARFRAKSGWTQGKSNDLNLGSRRGKQSPSYYRRPRLYDSCLHSI